MTTVLSRLSGLGFLDRVADVTVDAELERAGATIVHRETMWVSDSSTASKVGRLIVEWRRNG